MAFMAASAVAGAEGDFCCTYRSVCIHLWLEDASCFSALMQHSLSDVQKLQMQARKEYWVRISSCISLGLKSSVTR